jgi:hypothetical protein
VSHTVVIYGASESADSVLGRLTRAASERGGQLTVLALAVEEPEGRGCCDTRSVLWNGITREFAENDLARARRAVEDVLEGEHGTFEVRFEVLTHGGRRLAKAVEREALRRGASELVVADPRACGLSRREQRRLRAS